MRSVSVSDATMVREPRAPGTPVPSHEGPGRSLIPARYLGGN